MKILIIKTFPQEINSTTYNSQEFGQAYAFKKKGYICDVMCISSDGIFHKDVIKINEQTIILYKVKSYVFLKNAWLLDCYSILDQYDILQVSEYNQIYTWHLAKRYPNKIIVYHGPYYSSFNKRYNLMAKFFDMCFLNRYKKLNTCFITKSILAQKYLKSKGLINVYAVGVGLGLSFINKNTYTQVPEVCRIESINAIKLLYVGSIEERRNTLFLLDILSDLLYKKINVVLIIVGKSSSKKYEMLFHNKISQLNLKNFVIHIPVLQQNIISQIYSCSDIFLLPTRYDIFGMVLLEAMYYRKPVLTTMNGGSNMMIKSGENGYVLDSFKVDLWSDKIITLIENSNLRKLMGGKAHNTIVKQFTWENLVNMFIDIYRNK